MTRYVRCPGCGDHGDAAHIAACTAAKLESIYQDGAIAALLIAEKQLHRRGSIDFMRLVDAVMNGLQPRHERAQRRALRVHARRDRQFRLARRSRG